MDLNAIVFDIQKFSIHDGPGIRTTVFLKGCPLRCVWCHNPESWRPEPELLFTAAKCSGCRRCAEVCPTGVHSFTADGRHELDRAACVRCGKCVELCPAEALELCGRSFTVEEVMAEVRKDCIFYENSGGGMTLSGGEPMMRPEFTFALLNAAKKEGIHTALESCGFARREEFERILPVTDLFLFDIKTMDEAKHLRLTGRDNRLILSNLEFLSGAGAEIVLRCPLIPGLNDTPDELARIGELAERLSGVTGIDVEPYHPLGVSKAERLGQSPAYSAEFAPKGFAETCIAELRRHTTKPGKKN